MATVTKPMALDETLQTTNGLLTSTDSNSLADVMEDGIANIVTAIGAIPTPTAANVSFDDTNAGLGVSNAQDAIDTLNDNLTVSTLSSSLITYSTGYSGTHTIYKLGKIIFIVGSVTGTISATDTAIAAISSSIYPIDGSFAFGSARYGVSGSFTISGSVSILPSSGVIRLQGNNSTTGDFANYSVMYLIS